MLQRQVEECALDRRDGLIIACIQPLLAELEGQRVIFEGCCTVAEDVAGKLVYRFLNGFREGHTFM